MSEKIIDFSENSINDTEKIGSDTEKIEVNTEKIPEIIPEKTRYRGQRGPDKAQRKINPKSLGNLKPFQNLPEKDNLTISQDGSISEEEKPIWKKPVFWIGAGATITVFAYLAWRLYEIMDKSKQEDSEKFKDKIKQLDK